MRIVRAIVISAIVPLAVGTKFSYSEELKRADCPSVSITSHPESSCKLQREFAVQIVGLEPGREVSYQWTLSTGKILSGQGTRSISVTAPQSPTLTVTVEVKGLATECSSRASFTEPCEAFMVRPTQLLDQFGPLPFSKVKIRLDRFANQLMQNPGAQGYILVNGHWDRLASSKDYLIDRHLIEAGRVVSVRKKGRSPLLVKLYLVPTGSMPPGNE